MGPAEDAPGTVLVTGSGGFIGAWIVEEFVARGWRVLALVHEKTGARWERHVQSGAVVPIRSDITDAPRLRDDITRVLGAGGRRMDVVVHAAGRASDVGHRSAFRRTNLDGVRHIGELALAMDIRRFVFLSTTDVYGIRDFHGESEDDLQLEMTVPNPYPEFKILAEKWIREKFPPERFSILRPGAVWGPDDTTLTARILAFLRGSPVIIHFGPWRGRNRWPLAHVRNVATAALLASTRPEAAGKAINVMDTEKTSIDEFYRLLAGTFFPEKAFRTIHFPLSVGRGVGRAVSGVSNALDLDQPFMDPSFYAVHHVSSNLDFGNERLRALFAASGRCLLTREEGLRGLVGP